MHLFASASKSPASYRRKGDILAGIATAVLPTAAGALYLWLVPTGCDLRGDPTIYRWTCLLPGLLIVVSWPAGLLLPIASFLDQQAGRRFPDGWLATILACGLSTQAVLFGWYVFKLDPAYRSAFLLEMPFVPQPFLAGAIAGTVFWVTRQLLARNRSGAAPTNTCPL